MVFGFQKISFVANLAWRLGNGVRQDFRMPDEKVLKLFVTAGIRVMVLAVAVGCFSSVTSASTPRLSVILPRGVEVGAEHTLTFIGQRIGETEEVFFYEPGFTVKSLEPVDDKTVKVTVVVANDCRIGEHFAQLRTKNGISDFRSIHVGRLPGVAEQEPNNAAAVAQAIPMNVTVDGSIDTGDSDVFSVAGEKGDRLSVEIQAMRLGAFFDSTLSLFNQQGDVIASSDDTPLTGQDGFLSVDLPADGKYFIRVQDSELAGNQACRYRLHVGNFLRPSAVFPLGDQPAKDGNFVFIENSQNGFRRHEQLVKTPARSTDGLPFQLDELYSPTAMPFRVNELTNVFEVEPNNSYEKSKSVASLPAAFNGVIQTPGDFDFFHFKAKKGERWNVKCFANQLGSGLDPVVNIFNVKRKHIRGSDDYRQNLDSFFEFNVPADDEYFLRVFDSMRRGQPDLVYRVEITEQSPEFSLGIKRVDRYSQQRQAIAVPRGGRFAVILTADRKGFDGDITLNSDPALPLGIQAEAKPMKRGVTSMPVVFSVDENAELGGRLFDLTATAKVNDEETLTGHFKNKADLALGQPNNSVYHSGTVHQLAFAVTEKIPFAVNLVQPKVPLVRNGMMDLIVEATREEGFDGLIRLEFPFRSSGVGARSAVNIPKGKTSVKYRVDANSKARIGDWAACVTAKSTFKKGPVWTSSKLVNLTVAEPYVTAMADRISVQQGSTAELVCKLTHRVAFEGEASATLHGLPPNVTVDGPQTFDAKTQEVTFKLTASQKSPVGKHASVICRVHVPSHGETMISKACSATMLIKPYEAKKSLKADVVAAVSSGEVSK